MIEIDLPIIKPYCVSYPKIIQQGWGKDWNMKHRRFRCNIPALTKFNRFYFIFIKIISFKLNLMVLIYCLFLTECYFIIINKTCTNYCIMNSDKKNKELMIFTYDIIGPTITTEVIKKHIFQFYCCFYT